MIVRPGTAPSKPLTSSSRARSRIGTASSSTPCSARRTASTPRAVVHGAAGEDFVAAEETLCYLHPPAASCSSLIRRNPALRGVLLFRGLRASSTPSPGQRPGGRRERAAGAGAGRRCGPAVFIDGRRDASRRPATACATATSTPLFVRDGERVGVVTGMNLSKAVVLRRLPLDTPVRDICHFDVVAVDADDFIFDALLLMTRHNKRRVAVRIGRRIMSASSRTSTSWACSPATRSSSPAASTAPAASTISSAPAQRHPGPGRAAAPPGRQGRGDRRDHLGPQPPAVRQAVRDGRAALDPRARLPDDHGLRGPRRADRPDRPGQRPPAGRRRARRPISRRSATTSPARWTASASRPARATSWSATRSGRSRSTGFIRQLKAWVHGPRRRRPP